MTCVYVSVWLHYAHNTFIYNSILFIYPFVHSTKLIFPFAAHSCHLHILRKAFTNHTNIRTNQMHCTIFPSSCSHNKQIHNQDKAFAHPSGSPHPSTERCSFSLCNVYYHEMFVHVARENGMAVCRMRGAGGGHERIFIRQQFNKWENKIGNWRHTISQRENRQNDVCREYAGRVEGWGGGWSKSSVLVRPASCTCSCLCFTLWFGPSILILPVFVRHALLARSHSHGRHNHMVWFYYET